MRCIATEGPLAVEYPRTDIVDTLLKEAWGQGFAAPIFSEEVEVVLQRLVAEKHLALNNWCSTSSIRRSPSVASGLAKPSHCQQRLHGLQILRAQIDQHFLCIAIAVS